MKSIFIAFCLSFATASIHAAPRVGEVFNSETWAQWQTDLPRPTIVVFSTTDCVHCPDALERLYQRKGASAGLIAVVMDGLEAVPAGYKSTRYSRADRMFIFHGDEMRIRYTINPAWRGETPYIAVLGKKGGVEFFMGAPGDKPLARALRGQ